jgi:DNA-binding CsgD family transcriptional regulator/tetratricopeptide (TPR) repeat protein
MIRSDYMAAPLPGPLRLPPSFPFAGRSRELGALRALLPRADGEGRRAALVAGEAGSGKSRLVRELAHDLAADGALVLYGACDASVRTPYGPWVEALERLVRHAHELSLRDALVAGGSELSRLLPDLPKSIGELPPLVAADADTERHRLHRAVSELLTVAGRRTPVLLVLEDVHWADAPSLLLVRHLVRAGADARILLVATFRDAEADVPAELSEALVALSRTEGVMRLRLGGLSDDELAEFARLAAGTPVSPETIAALAELTAGNAFLVTQLWRELVESGGLRIGTRGVELVRPVGELGTPETVREVVSHRVDRLEPATAGILELAAVAGSAFTLDLLRRASAVTEATLLDAVDDAVRSGLLLDSPGPRLAYRFTHELVRRAVSDRLSAVRRAELHLKVAEALERVPADGEGRLRLAVLAHHYTAAAPVGAAERAIESNLLAAESAFSSLAFEETVARLRTALEVGIAEPRRRAEIHLQLGRAYHRAGHAADALGAFGEAAAIARRLEDNGLLAQAAIGFEDACWRPGIYDEGSVELLLEAIEAIGGSDRDARTRLLRGLARALDFVGQHERAAVARDEAIRLARASGDRSALGWILAAAYWSRGVMPDAEINAMLREASELGETLGDVELHTEALAWLVPSYVNLFDHQSARLALARTFEAARRMSQTFYLHVAEHYASALALCDGDLAGAEQAAQRSHEWSQLLTGRDASGVYGIQMFGVRREQGRLAELAPVIRVLAGREFAGAWRPALVVVLAELGMDAEARHELTRIADHGLDDLRPSLWIASVVYLADACTLLGDDRTAELLYAELAPLAGTNVQVGHLVACYGAADRYLGSLAATLGEWEAAERHFEAALALNRRIGARTWIAHTAFAYARMLASAGRRDAAAALLAEAHALATEVGMPALQARLAALGAPAVAWPDGLSHREVEILRLVARGLSNREVGRALHISEHTAANHVRNILRKTGCANRTEATAYAHRRQLVSG